MSQLNCFVPHEGGYFLIKIHISGSENKKNLEKKVNGRFFQVNGQFFLFFDAFKVVAAEMAKTFNLPGVDMLTEGPRLFFAVSALIYAGSIAGAILMWQLRKIGFHVYTISQILLVVAPMYFYKLPGPGITDILFAGVFVFLYSTNLKTMS